MSILVLVRVIAICKTEEFFEVVFDFRFFGEVFD